jgi:hypothetical protein
VSYGYIKGTEKTSLSYFEALFAQTVDAKEREKIAAIIDELKESLSKQRKAFEDDAPTTIHHASDSWNIPSTGGVSSYLLA